MLHKRLLALISLNAVFVVVALLMTGGTAAEMSDFESSGTQTLTAGELDIVPGTTTSTDFDLAFSDLTPTNSVTQSFTVTNTATPTTNADIYIWLDPASSGFPFCGGTVEPVSVTIADETNTPQTFNLCELINDADADSAGLSDGSEVPFQIADAVAGGTPVSRSMELTLASDAVPADWSNVSGTAVLTISAVQDGGPAPAVTP